MVVDDLTLSPSYRLSKVLSILESNHGVTVDFASANSIAELQSVYEMYGQECSKIISESAYNSYNEDPQYTEAVLIREAIQIFLSEVAPKRIKRSHKTSS